MIDEYEDEFTPIFVPATNYTFKEVETICHYNETVICTERGKCSRCGWNPVVAKIRADKIRRELERKG